MSLNIKRVLELSDADVFNYLDNIKLTTRDNTNPMVAYWTFPICQVFAFFGQSRWEYSKPNEEHLPLSSYLYLTFEILPLNTYNIKFSCLEFENYTRHYVSTEMFLKVIKDICRVSQLTVFI